MKEVNQKPIIAIPDDLAHRRRVRRNHECAIGHVFEERPRQNKWVGEIVDCH